MIYLKKFENLSENSEFKIGDYVRLRDSDGYIYQITYRNDFLNDPWYLEDTLEKDGYKRDDIYWVPDYRLILVPQYEIDAPKYNL